MGGVGVVGVRRRRELAVVRLVKDDDAKGGRTVPRGEDVATTVLTWAWAPRYGPVFVGSCEVTLADEAEEL